MKLEVKVMIRKLLVEISADLFYVLKFLKFLENFNNIHKTTLSMYVYTFFHPDI